MLAETFDLLTSLPFGLIVIQPDLGTAGLVALIAVTITLFVKVELRALVLLVAPAAAMVPVVWVRSLGRYR